MNISWSSRAKALVISLVLAISVSIAAGCSGSGGGSASGLSFVPRGAIAYVLFDTNFEGTSWKKANKLLKAFPSYEPARDKQLTKVAKKKNGFKYSRDIKPWLGDHGGAAVLTGDSAVGWVEVKDEKKAAKFFKSRGKSQKKTKYKGVEITTSTSSDGEKNVWAVTDGLILFSDKVADIKKALAAHDSDKTIDKVDAVSDVADHARDGALITIVVNGKAARDLLNTASMLAGPAAQLTKLPQVKAFNGAVIDVTAQSAGFHTSAFAGFNQTKLKGAKFSTKKFKPELIETLPANTIGVITGSNLGELLNQQLKQAKSLADFGSTITKLEAAYGISGDDFEDTLTGEFALVATASELGVPGFGMVFDAEDEAKTTQLLGALMTIVKSTTGKAIKETTLGSAKVSTLAVNPQVNLQATVVDGHGLFGAQPFAESITGTSSDVSLGTNADFKDAWDAAGIPDEVTAALYVNPQAALGLVPPAASKAYAKDAEALGPWVGWVDSDSDSVSFDLFLGVNS